MTDARRRHYLMCRPDHFDVAYSINPWMDPGRPTSGPLALAQWRELHGALIGLGHRVDVLEPVPGLPDMVFAANGAVAVGTQALVANFRHVERAAESGAYLTWFAEHGYTVRQAERVNEGEGDYLVAGAVILAGSGFRSDVKAHTEVEEYFGLPVIGLELVDPRFYHLDTALAVLSDDDVMYYPAAFSADSQALLQRMYPDALLADETDAVCFGLNAVSDGLNVLLASGARRMAARLAERGYRPAALDSSELLKAGGSLKCCVLELRT